MPHMQRLNNMTPYPPRNIKRDSMRAFTIERSAPVFRLKLKIDELTAPPDQGSLSQYDDVETHISQPQDESGPSTGMPASHSLFLLLGPLQKVIRHYRRYKKKQKQQIFAYIPGYGCLNPRGDGAKACGHSKQLSHGLRPEDQPTQTNKMKEDGDLNPFHYLSR